MFLILAFICTLQLLYAINQVTYMVIFHVTNAGNLQYLSAAR
jgi:hypothetical protein